MSKEQQPVQSKPKKERKAFKRIRESFSELKKVSWPTFGHAVAKTGAVIAVVLFFAVILTALDFGLSELYKLLVSGLK